MHAWAALKPADIVAAARELRDMVSGGQPDDRAPDARAAEATPAETAPTEGSAPAE